MSWFKKESIDVIKQVVIGVSVTVLTAVVMIAVEAAKEALSNRDS